MNEQDSSPAKKYHAIQNRLFFAGLLLNILFLAIFFSSGLSVNLRNQSINKFSGIFLANGFYASVFFIVFYILNFPFNFYEGFLLEHKFKLSNQGLLNWFKDDFKKLILDFILTLIAVEAVYFFLNKSQNLWWFWAALFWVFLTLILAKITPNLIIPLFYKYIPITDSQLKERIFSLFDKCGVKIKDATSINFSLKTKKANAFVCGLGKNKKVVLSDTLLNEFKPEEIENVLSHELGHYLNHDILKLIIVNSLFTFFGFFMMDKIIKNLINSLGLSGIADIAFLPVFALCLILLGFIILPLQNGFSRYLERRADLFSLNLTKDKASFISMMEKLGKMNLADFSPGRFIEIWLYDHPPIAKRIKFAQDFKFED